MRVIGGEFRSRVLVAPPGSATRPTSDRLRETLFNVLTPKLQGARFADLYAGSGAVGIEALSRGAWHSCFMERSPAALNSLRKNLESLKLVDKASVVNRAVLHGLRQAAREEHSFDLIFLDPPYESEREYLAVLDFLGDQQTKLLSPGAILVAEHARRATLPARVGTLRRSRILEQGDAALSFYQVSAMPLGDHSRPPHDAQF